MTRKDYQKIAAVLAATRVNAVDKALNVTMVRLADVFLADNPRFDRDRFYKASGFPWGDN